MQLLTNKLVALTTKIHCTIYQRYSLRCWCKEIRIVMSLRTVKVV
jgi:hypothetical protein